MRKRVLAHLTEEAAVQALPGSSSCVSVAQGQGGRNAAAQQFTAPARPPGTSGGALARAPECCPGCPPGCPTPACPAPIAPWQSIGVAPKIWLATRDTLCRHEQECRLHTNPEDGLSLCASAWRRAPLHCSLSSALILLGQEANPGTSFVAAGENSSELCYSVDARSRAGPVSPHPGCTEPWPSEALRGLSYRLSNQSHGVLGSTACVDANCGSVRGEGARRLTWTA